MKIVLAIIIFSAIVLFHELGHFLFAKKCNVKVNEFCLGLGPTVFSWGKGETKYSLRLLPFGGACVMEGEDDNSSDERAFYNKTAWERFQIVFAGPFFNFILAYVLACFFIAMAGFDTPVISGVMEGYGAEAAGLQVGDRIIKMNNYNIHFYQEVTVYNYFHNGEAVDVVYERDGDKHTAHITPIYSDELGKYLIGINGNLDRQKGNIFEVLEYGAYEVKYQIYITINSLKMLFTGQLGVKDMSGPVAIVDTISDVYEQSIIDGVFYVIVNMLSIAILLSANLGVMNLLPLPALDGGRIFLIFIELVRGKKLKAEVEGFINMVGFAMLMALMVFVMYNDITKLIK